MLKISGIIFSSLNKNTLSRLTATRTVAAIPFACRYRLVDFCLSNLVNANIYDISIVANYNYRSLLEHLGSGKDFDLARRAGGINFVSPFQNISDISEVKMFSTHLEALRSMYSYIMNSDSDYFILMDSDTVLNIDLKKVVSYHEKRGSELTMVTKRIDTAFSSKHPRMMIKSKDGKINDIAMSEKSVSEHEELALGIIVVGKLYLSQIIEEAMAHNYNSLTRYILRHHKENEFYTYLFDGYSATVSSFLDYYKYSMDLVYSDSSRRSLLEATDKRIYTKIHNSAPKLYKKGATVKNSLLADESVIEGTVINSVIFRGVKIEAGAVVKNCVLFHGTYVGKGAKLNCIVTDKDVYISENTELSGSEGLPFYVQKGRRV